MLGVDVTEKNTGSVRNREYNFKYGSQEMLHYLYFNGDEQESSHVLLW